MPRRAVPVLLFLTAALALPQPLRADEVSESIHRLESDVTALTERGDTLSSQMQALREEISRLRSANTELKQQLAAAQSRDVVSREDLKRVVEQIAEVDKRRAEDARYVKVKLEEIALLASRPAPPPPEEPKPVRTKPPEEERGGDGAVATEFYEHEVAKGDTLGAIVDAYNKQYGMKVTIAQVLKVNPRIKDPKGLVVGKKIKIPIIK